MDNTEEVAVLVKNIVTALANSHCPKEYDPEFLCCPVSFCPTTDMCSWCGTKMLLNIINSRGQLGNQ